MLFQSVDRFNFYLFIDALVRELPLQNLIFFCAIFRR